MSDIHPSIHHIVFDLGNVLVRLDRETPFRRLLPHLPPDRAALAREDRAAFDNLIEEPAIALETGQIDFGTFHRRVCDILGISLGQDRLHVMWCDMFHVDNDMVALGRRLSASYDTTLASNTSRVHYDWIIEKFPEVAFFRAAALSYELGVMKPARQYYEQAIDRFAIDPSRAVFIDDLEQNVAAAEQCGFNGIVFKDMQALVNELETLGVRVPGN
jgi:putative hydrolase of the HAD superfamily